MGAALLVLTFAVGARAATVDHFRINSVSVTEGDVGTLNMTFAISYTGPLNNISVDWATADGTAVGGADYVAASGTATFLAAGPASQNITVQVSGDLLDEANETFTVNLSNPQPPATADITTATGTGTITDNDPLPSIVINDVSVAEGNAGTTNADFSVTLSAPSGRNVTVNYATANSSAVQPGDYTTTSGTLTFLPGQVAKTISVPVVGDVLDEIDETFFVNLSGATNATIADTQGIGTVIDDDPAPSITINDVSLTEGNAGTSNMTFTATLSAASGKTVTVDYATADVTATAPADYTVTTGTLSFAPLVLTRTFNVPIVGDTRDEFDEALVADLTNPMNATIADSQGVGTIVDNDPTPGLVINNVTVTEVDAGTVTATFTATLSAASNKLVTVDYATSDLTALAPADYTAATGTLTFTPGTTTQPIAITVQGDLLNEASETYRVTLSNPFNATITTANGTGTITDNDPLPSIVINDVTIAEGNAGTTNATFTLTLSAPSGRVVTVRATTANGTATQPADYTSTNLIVTFPAGTTTQSYSVPVVGDVLDEADDTFFVNLTTPTNSTIADAQGIGTITDDDPLPSITINDVSRVEGNAGTANLTFTVTLAPVSGRTVTVDYSMANVTATAPSDYTASAGTVTFNAGTTTRTIAVPIVGDTIDEFDETFTLDLSSPSNATIADNQGIGTINDNDAAPTVSVNNVTVTEGDIGTTPATFTVSLSAPSGKTVSVDYATADGSALAGSGDYVASSGTLTFNPGLTTQPVAVTVNGDTTFELGETFTLTLSNPSAATIGAGVGFGTIVNDDITPGLAVTDVSVPEGNAGDTLATFTVALGAPSAFPVTVDVATLDGTATQPSDYDPVAITSLTFVSGETKKTVDVTIRGDTVVEPDETFTVQLSNAVGATIGDDTGIGTITDDDRVAHDPVPPPAWPVASISDASTIEGARGSVTTLAFPVTLTRAATGDVTIDYRTRNGSAIGGSDFDRVARSVRIPAGALTGTVRITVIGDDRVEPDETFSLVITGIAGADRGTDGTGTIVNDDRSSTRLTLHVRVHGHRARSSSHRVEVRGRLIGGATGVPVKLVLMRERDGGWIAVDRAIVLTRRKPHVMTSGATAFAYRSTFHVTRGGRYRIRANFRGDDLHAPTRAHVRFRI